MLLLNEDTFIPRFNLRQSRFTYSPFQPFTKIVKGIKIKKKAGDLDYIYKNKLDKACFSYDAT